MANALILNPNGLFDSANLSQDLARKSIRGGMTTMGAQGVKFVLSTAGTIVLARLLTPADYGLVGMVTVVVGFAAMFKDAGLSMATVQKEKISHEQISTLFWINVLISAGLGLCVLASAPLVAMFYGKPELTAVTAALSLSFILSGLTIQHQALQRRHMRFGTLATIQIAAQVVTLIVTIALALLGWRYWALVGGTLAHALAGSLFTFALCPWLPGRMRRGAGVRDMLKFGGHLTGFNFINYFSRNADNILIGRFIGADALGLYAKAYHLFMMPIAEIRQPINNVAVPALCAIRNEPERYRKFYRQIIFLVAGLCMPLVGFTIVFADQIILLMLGSQWMGAVPVFQVLAAVGFVQAPVQIGRGLPLMSMGHGRRYLYFGIVTAVATVLGMAVGLRWGIVGVAAGYGIAFCLLIPFTVPWCLKGSPVSSRDWLLALYTPALATLVMVPVMIWIKRLILPDAQVFNLPVYSSFKVIILGGLGGMAAYGLALLALPLGRESLLGAFKHFKGAVRGRKIAVASSIQIRSRKYGMIRVSKLPGAVLRRLMGLRWFRWLFISRLYRKPIAHSEAIIAHMGNKANLDESYWAGKVRQFAHVVDKGLHRGDFTKGHGISGYRAAKDALSRIRTPKTLSDPLVQWASNKVCLYEQLQNGHGDKLRADYVATKCRHADLVDAIQTRRSIRCFTELPVEDDVIEKIASVLDWAPTSCHRQPGRVYASNNPDIVQQCMKLHIGAACFTDIYSPLFMTFCADSRLYRMPDELAIPYIDVSLGIQNCLLVAHTLGLSLTPLIWAYQGEWQEHELRNIFSIPAHFQIILSVVGGYPDGGAQVPPRKHQELFIVK